MISFWRAVTLHLENVSLMASTICVNAELGRITQAYDKHTRTWSGFEISFTEYVEETSLTNLPSHRRRDRKPQITPPELSELRALNGQLLSLSVQCLQQLLAPLSMLMGQTPQATVDTICEVNKLAR